MKLSVIGAGYVGLTTAACLAQIGHEVLCSESDLEKLSKLQNGGMPLFEPHLEDIIKAVRRSGRLCFGSTEEAIVWGDAIFICVGTPPLANGDADLSGTRMSRHVGERLLGDAKAGRLDRLRQTQWTQGIVDRQRMTGALCDTLGKPLHRRTNTEVVEH